MTQQPDSVACRYTAQIRAESGQYLIKVPDAEVELGTLSTDEAYRVTIEYIADTASNTGAETQTTNGQSSNAETQAPVSEGEQLDVEIEDLGQQGDGIARVGPGYVLIVPGSDVGEHYTVEIQQITPSFGFAEIIESDESEVVDQAVDTESVETSDEAN